MKSATLNQIVINPGDPLYPRNRWCKSGHEADAVVILDGQPQPMRFFKVTGEVLAKEHHGLYCEKCMITANLMAKNPTKLGLF